MWCRATPYVKIKKINTRSIGQDLPKHIASKLITKNNSVVLCESFYLPGSSSLEGSLVYNLQIGEYRLLYEYFRGKDKIQFNVVRYNLCKIATVSVTPVEGGLKVKARLQNCGANNFTGSVKLITDFYEEERMLNIPVGAINDIVFYITKPNIPAGTYTILIQLLYDNNVLDYIVEEASFEPHFIIAEYHKEPEEFAVAATGTFVFKIKNIGNAVGSAEISFTVLDLLAEERDIVVEAGSSCSLSFSLQLPDELINKEYSAVIRCKWYDIFGRERRTEKEVKFTVWGIDIQVEASLEKILYKEGEVATFSIKIINKKEQMQELSLCAMVRFNDYGAMQQFNLLPATQTIVNFYIPVSFPGDVPYQKLFYGIYTSSGYVLYLNSTYLREKKDVISLYTDKQIYYLDEQITIHVEIEDEKYGTLTFSALNYYGCYKITSTTWTTCFLIKPPLYSGSYFIDYLYEYDGGRISNRYIFEIVGYEVRILECQLDKARYELEDTMNIKFKIKSNYKMPIVLRGYLSSPVGKFTELFNTASTLTTAEDVIFITATLSTEYIGRHRLIYRIYDSNESSFLLVEGVENFDVSRAVKLYATPTIGLVGTIITVMGEDYYPMEQIIINFGGYYVATAAANFKTLIQQSKNT